jgi:cytochrome c-type biogenesis protein CcmH
MRDADNQHSSPDFCYHTVISGQSPVPFAFICVSSRPFALNLPASADSCHFYYAPKKQNAKYANHASRALIQTRQAKTANQHPSFVRLIFLALVLLSLATTASLAVEPSEQLKNPALEARARAISSGLRCLVCQNETIDESNASLAHDIRILLRERLTEGDTDDQAVQAIVSRYGEFVLLNPPVRPETYVLWFGPLTILLIGLIAAAVWLRRRITVTDATIPLTPEEQRRLDTLMREADR